MKWFSKKKNNDSKMNFMIIDADYAPDDLPKQLPVSIELIREIPGSDRPDYWLAKTETPVKWDDKTVNYLIVAPRLVGDSLNAKNENVAVGLAYVTDESLLDDTVLNFDKCKYVAICMLRRKHSK